MQGGNEGTKIELHPTICPYCGNFMEHVEYRRMNTQYVNAASNYITSCIPCFEESEAYWSDMWSEYYSGLL